MTYYNTAKITGRVFLDQNGDNTEYDGSGGYESGIAGQTVKLLNSSGQVIATTTTSSNGTYTFSNLPGGYYTVLFPTSIGDLSLVEQDVGDAYNDSDANVDTGKTATICLNSGQCLSNVDAGYADLTTEDGTVEGTGGNDVIDVAYTGDPDGDMVDNNDAILAGHSGDDDLIEAYGGDDLVKAGAGDDTVYGGYGNDEVYTGSGNDTAFGENGADTLVGGSGDDELYGGGQNDVLIGDGADMESGVSYDGKVLVWENVATDGTCLGSSTDHNVGGINVNIGFQGQDYGAYAKISNENVYVESGEGMDGDSSLKLYGQGGEGGWDNTSKTTLSFSSTNGSYEDEVENVAFRIDDIDLSTAYCDDHIDRVTILAYDADGSAVEVVLTPELNGQTVSGNTATGTVEHNSGVTPAAQMGSVLVTIAGPVSKIVIDYDNGGSTDQQVNVTDVTFDAVTVTDVPDGAAGSDVLYGGAGDDIIEGNGEDDSLYGGIGDDALDGGEGSDLIEGGDDADYIYGGAGDTVDGGTGGNDNDTLDLTGQGPFYIENETVDADGDSTSGTIVFVDGAGVPTGETLSFTEIEKIIGEQVNRGPDAVDDSDTTDFNTAVTVDLLANDTDPDGDALSVTDATLTQGEGELVDNGDGTFTFTPAMGFSGDAVITYTISDGNGGTDTATHTITVGEPPLDGTVNGTDGDDIIDGGYLGDPEGDRVDHNDAIIGNVGSNDDIIEAYGGNDTVLAGQGDDTVYGGDGDDSILGQGGNDSLYGEDGNDSITGGRDDDLIYGGAGNDTIDGMSGDDTIQGNGGSDVIYGGGGLDTLSGGQGDDTVIGGNNVDMIFGGADDDYLEGGGSDDKIEGGSGDDTIDGGTGNDDLWGASGDDTVYGGTGHDTISTAEGNDVVDGGDGDDIIDTGNDENPATGQNLPDQGYPGVYPGDLDPNDDLDTVYGGAGNDTISTGDDDDTIYGGEGRDVIDAGIDDDFVDAGADNDTVIGSEGNDEIYGGDGNDTIYGGLVTPGPADALNLPDDLDGDGDSNDPGEDLVTDNNNDTLFGGAGNDTIYGADDDDTLYGGTGDDYLDGGVDDDIIEGGDGEDVIVGGQGNDQMYGGLGSDTFLGGNGGDHVVGGEDPDLDGDGQSDETDVLDLTGSGVDFITYVDGDPEAGTVTFLDGSTMTFEEIENVIPCFTPGTTIATPKGERLVEELREGDRIITRDNGIQEIRWVGRKEVTGKQLVKNPHLKPILIKAGALGNGLPERDMLVSPNHRMLVASDQTQLYFEEREVLASAKHLVGSQGIHELDVMQTTYIHFMFDRHEVVLSNGAWTESFQPGDYSLKGIGNSQRNEIFELFPELSTKTGLEGYQSARRALKKHEAKLLVK